MSDRAEESRTPILPLSGPGEFAAEPPRIEGYEIMRELGAGGMGLVYLAEQKTPVQRQVAVKVIRPGLDSRQVISRFEAERQALALMDHPNIAHVLGAGTTLDGRPFFVMEYVAGQPLTAYCDACRLSIEDRLQLFLQVCEALQYAHQKGIIHRDLKPSNILVTDLGGHPLPKIIDFGVAKAVHQPLTERTLLTERGQLIGTPEYMSPEQAGLTQQGVDTRSDIYSLGIVLYELLTGKLPFDRETLEGEAYVELLRIIREQDPPRPSTRLRSLGAEARAIAAQRCTQATALIRRLQRELEWIPLKAMRKEPNHRYRTAADLADDIRNYLAGAPLMAGPESFGYRTRKLVRRHRALVIGASAVALSLLGGIVSSTIFGFGQARARMEAVAARDEAQRQARISEAVNNFINRDLLASPNPSAARGRNVTVLEVLDAASKRVQGRFVDAPLIEAGIRSTLGITYLSLGQYEKAEPHSVRAFDLYREQLGEEHRDTLAALVNLALLYQDQGRYAEAEPLCLKALAICRRVLGEENLDTLSSMNNLARLYQIEGRYAEAEPLCLKALQVRQRVLGEEHPVTLGSMSNLAALYHARGRDADAEPLWLKALEIQKRVLGEEHPDTLISMSNLAALYHAQKRYADAEPLHRAALEIRTRVLGKEHPDTLISMSSLAIHYQAQGRYADAEPLHRAALEIQKRVLGEEHPDVARSLYNLGRLRNEQHDEAKAEALFQEAIKIWRKSLGDENAETIGALAGLFTALVSQKKAEAAETLGRELLPLQAKVLGDADPLTFSTKGLFAELLKIRGKSAEAEVLRQEVRRAKAPEARQPSVPTSSLAGTASPIPWDLDASLGVILDERFADNPLPRFKILPIPPDGNDKVLAGGLTNYDDAGHSFSVDGYLGLVRPVQAGAHVALDLELVFDPPDANTPAKMTTMFQLVLFDRSMAGIEIQRSLRADGPAILRFTLSKRDRKDPFVLREIGMKYAPSDGLWRLKYRHGLLTLFQSSHMVASADIGALGVQVAGVFWIQRGGKLTCRQMTLYGQPPQETSDEDNKVLQQAATLNEQAQALFHEGRVEEALPKMQEASALFVKVNGEHHYDSANSYGNLAMMLQARQKFVEADEHWSKALATHEETLGPAHPHTTMTRFRYGQCCLEAGKKEKARELWQRCRDDWQAVLGDDYSRVETVNSKLRGL